VTNPTGMRRRLTNYGDSEFALFLRKSFIKAMGYSDDALSRPIIGITNTFSAYNACHKTVPDIIDAIKRGVMLAGGLPFEFPVISMHEAFSHPTSMYLRNLMSVDAEEMITAQPMDAVVLIGGCDKTVPALLMAAASADVPAILEVTGPMLTGRHRGERVGACTDCRRYWARHRAGDVDAEEITELNDRLAPTAGTCGVMGTASTMALLAETWGMILPGGATIPAVLSDRLRHAEATGRRAVEIAAQKLMPSQVMTEAGLLNALKVLHATGGSTNALIHMTAIAGRLGLQVDLDAFDAIGRETPVLVDLKPSGQHYMEDLHNAGGLAAVLLELKDLLDLDQPNIDGRTLGEIIEAHRPVPGQDVVRAVEAPLSPTGGLRLLRGNIAPRGAIIKQSSATPELLVHEGRAVVFESLEDMAARIDDPELDVAADDVVVLRNAGPKGAPGMPEAGYIPIPKKLAEKGVRDMVRMSDARMSGTAFGTVILHVCPESADGGPLGLIRNGDRIRLDAEAGRIDLLVSDDVLETRASELPTTARVPERGYAKLFQQHVLQADEGCDFDFLVPGRTA